MTRATHLNVDYQEESRFNAWLGKGILMFGIAFNAFLGYTIGFAVFAAAMAVLVLLFDLAKIRMTRNAVLAYKEGRGWFFPGSWVIVLTLLSIGAGTMFYAYNMDNVAKQAHNNSEDVKLSKQAFELAQQQAKSVQGFDMMGAGQKIGEIGGAMDAILGKAATNSNGSPAGTVGSRTENCSGGSNFYANKYAADCTQYQQLSTQLSSLRSQTGMADRTQSAAMATSQTAINAMQNFSVAEGVPGFKVLANAFYPDMEEKAAINKVFTQTTVTVALINELLGTSLILYSYLLGLRTGSPAPLQPTGSDDDSYRDGGYKTSNTGFTSPTPTTANRNHSPRAQAQPTGQSHPQNNSPQPPKMANNHPTRAQSRANQAWGVNGNNAMKLDPILGTAEEQLPLPELSTYRAELTQAGIDSPKDDAMQQKADKASIERIIKAGQKANSKASQPALQSVSDRTRTVGRSESEANVKADAFEIRNCGLSDTEGFKAFRKAIQTGTIKPSSRPCKLWISEHEIMPNASIKAIQETVESWLARLAEEGVLDDLSKMENWKSGKAKYQLSGVAK